LLFTPSNVRRIAWNPALESYLTSHFTQIYESPNRLTLYVRKGLRTG
jgi:hypothetical protein